MGKNKTTKRMEIKSSLNTRENKIIGKRNLRRRKIVVEKWSKKMKFRRNEGEFILM